MGLPKQGPYVPVRPVDPGKGLMSSLCLPWPLPPAWRPVAELPLPCRAGCRMMVVLDRTRSHESMRRWAAASESKRCPASRLPRLPAAPGSLGGGAWLTAVSPHPVDRGPRVPGSSPAKPGWWGRGQLWRGARLQSAHTSPTCGHCGLPAGRAPGPGAVSGSEMPAPVEGHLPLGGGLPDSPKTFRVASADPHSHLGGLGGGWGLGLGAALRSLAPCSGRQLSLEEPVPTAILLSLVGVGSVLVNQWPARLQDNALRASTLWESEWAPPPPPQPPDACRGAWS